MNLKNLKQIVRDLGGKKIYVKALSSNDNSKNQVYLAGSFDVLNILPISDIYTDSSGDWNKDRFKATLNFGWIQDDGIITNAPNSKLILYPKYPEVRFSGFLQGCKNAPSELMTQRIQDRLLFLSVASDGKVIGYVASPKSILAKEFQNFKVNESFGIFQVVDLSEKKDSKKQLLNEIKRIHDLGWIISKRLDKEGNILPCLAPNCGGYTLEAELGITPNGFSEPDYLGWEIKQFHVANFNRYESSVITLMTPEPTNGYYVEKGTEDFIRKYGYADMLGRKDRFNFGGIHKIDHIHNRTNLKLILIGFDKESGKIRNSNGKIALIDKDENIAASWDFASLLKHWNRKHNNACYVPSLSENKPIKKYFFGDKIMLGIKTDFQLFLKEMSLGHIYYDPGIKLENASTKPKIKKRSQFRIKSGNVPQLYFNSEVVSLDQMAI